MFNIIAGFLTLTALEITLGIDNIVLLAVITNRLPGEQQERARRIGLVLAMIQRIMLLGLLNWINQLNIKLFYIGEWGISGRNLILCSGGIFLAFKGIHEILGMLQPSPQTEKEGQQKKVALSFTSAMTQIALLDIAFSLDSIITAIGMVDNLGIMVAAVIASVGIMMVAADSISRFILANPRIKLLALAFLTLVGFFLVADGIELHIPKGYLYFALAFSLSLELIQFRVELFPNGKHHEA